MSTQSLAADVLDALVTVWRADATLTAYGNRLYIHDGPPVTNRATEIELWVGATGLTEEETVINGTQSFVVYGDATADRDEALDIQNAIWVYAGSTDIGTTRRTALTAFNAAVAAIRGTDLGIGPLDPSAEVTSWDLHQGEFTSGAGVAITFTVHVTGQL